MTDDECNRCRKLQDLLIELAERHGLSDQDRLSLNLPAAMTVGNLRKYIYPNFMAEMMATFREYIR